MHDPPRGNGGGSACQCGQTPGRGGGRLDLSKHRRSSSQITAIMSVASPPWTMLPRFQLVLGGLTFALVALVTAAPVLVVILGAVEGNAWRETFVESSVNRSAIGYSFLLALRAPIAAIIGF